MINLRNAVSCRVRVAVTVRRLYYTMNGALDGIIAPSRQQIARVDDHRVLNWRSIDELPIGALHLQPPAGILEQQRDRAVVRVLSCPHLAWVRLEDITGHSRVV